MAIAPEPGKTKCPTCSSAMVPVGVSNEEGQTVQYLDCQNVVISSNNPPERPRALRLVGMRSSAGLCPMCRARL